MADERTFIGLYSGPGADGVDAVLAGLHGRREAMKARQLSGLHRPFEEHLRRRIAAALQGRRETPLGYAELDRDVGAAFARAAEALLKESRTDRAALTAAGMSGQVLSRAPSSGEAHAGAGMVVGSPAVVAERLGCPVVSGFEASDQAAGGAGAPITPWADWVLFRDRRLSRVVVHLGAVATLTFVPAGATPGDVSAFDAGPGTAVLDALAGRLFARPFDADGSAASRGQVNAALLNEMLAHPYFRAKPPKITHVGQWSEAYLWRLTAMGQKHKCSGADLLATAVEMVARSIAQAAAGLTERPHQVVLAGGGALNIHLAGRIRALLSPSSTVACGKFGVGIRLHAPLCYAILAAARLQNHPTGIGSVTGASRDAVLGSVTSP